MLWTHSILPVSWRGCLPCWACKFCDFTIPLTPSVGNRSGVKRVHLQRVHGRAKEPLPKSFNGPLIPRCVVRLMQLGLEVSPVDTLGGCA